MWSLNWCAEGRNFGPRLLLGSSKVCLALLLTTLLAARPLRAAAVTPDPVLEWIAIMNTTVIAGGTSPLVTSG